VGTFGRWFSELEKKVRQTLDCNKLVKQLLAGRRVSAKKSEVQKPSLSLLFLINQDNKLHTDRQPLSVKPQKVFELKVGKKKKKSSALLPLHHFRLWQVRFSSSSKRSRPVLPEARLCTLCTRGFSQAYRWGGSYGLSGLLGTPASPSLDSSATSCMVMNCIKIDSSLSCNFMLL